MKTFLSRICLTVAMLLSTLAVSAYDFEVDGIYYHILSATDLTCEVVSGDIPYNGDLVIPSGVQYKNKTLIVNSLSAECCAECNNLISIQLPSTVKTLGRRCFAGCSHLSSIALPELTMISESCFSNCIALASIEIPESVMSLKPSCFYNCKSLSTLSLPSGIVEIPKSAFENSGLTSIIIPKEVQSFGENCFAGCDKLSKLYLNGNIEAGALRCGAKKLTIGEACDNITLAGMGYSLYTKETPGEVYLYDRYDIYYTDFTAPYYLNTLIIEDGLTPLMMSVDDCSIKPSARVYEDKYRESKTHLQESWSSSLEVLYIGRELRSEDDVYLWATNLTSLTIGPNVNRLDRISGSHEKLEFLKSLNPVPPIISALRLTEVQFASLEVEVPEEALEAYQADPVWGKFWNLKGVGVESVTADSTKTITGRYNLSGTPVDEDYKGLVVVRFSDGTAKKTIQ